MQQNDLLDSVLTLGSMVRRGLTETGPHSLSEATPNVRTARAPSETAPTPPTGAQALHECELVFVPRSCQATRSRHLFSIAHPTVVFIILPVPERGLTMESATLKDPPSPPPLPPQLSLDDRSSLRSLFGIKRTDTRQRGELKKTSGLR